MDRLRKFRSERKTLALLDGYRLQRTGASQSWADGLYRGWVLRGLRRAAGEGAELLVVARDGEAVASLQAALPGVDVVSLLQQLRDVDTEVVTREAAILATSWFKGEGREAIAAAFEFDGMSVLEAHYEGLVVYFIESINTTVALESLFERQRPRRVILEHRGTMQGVARELLRRHRPASVRYLMPMPAEAALRRVRALWAAKSAALPLARHERGDRPPSPANPILFAPQSPSVVGAYLPVARCLAERGEVVAFLLARAWGPEVTAQVPPSNGVLYLEDFVPADIGERVAEAMGQLLPRAMRVLRSRAPGPIRHQGLALEEEFRRWLRRGLPEVMRESLFYLFAYREMLAAVRPRRVMVSADQNPRGHPLVRAAERGGVPTIRMDGGNVGEAIFRHVAKVKGVGRDGAVTWDLYVDRLAVETRRVRDRFVGLGIDAERIGAVGFPRLDQLCPDAEMTPPEAVTAALGIRPSEKVVLCAVMKPWRYLGCTAETRRRFLRALVEILADLGGVFLMVKPHPSDATLSRGDVEELMRASGLRGRVIDRQFPMPRLLAITDLAIAPWSTVALESVVLGRPALLETLSWHRWFADPPWSLSRRLEEAGLLPVVTSRSEMAAKVRQLLGDQGFAAEWRRKQRAFVAAEMPALGGTASGLTASLIQRAITARVRAEQPAPLAAEVQRR
ncbi:MAG: CDP-glycerol glycerophosphotransferase family protein [Gemmatimonadetes bacterium]|nr:CDP-glycerol glycerophosphotransferase family protein [Gemmatimonadota bacterium]